MRRLSFLLLLFFPFCFSQVGAHRISQVLVKGNNIAANVAPFASVRVCVARTHCSTEANIFSDQALTQSLAQPLTADGSGNYDYYVALGCVDEEISTPGQGQTYLYNVCPNNGQSGGGGGTPAAPVYGVQYAGPGATAFNADATFNYTPSTHALGTTVLAVNAVNPTTNYSISETTNYTGIGTTRNDFLRSLNFGGTGGINYGNYTGITGHPWTTAGNTYWNGNKLLRGIGQWLSGNWTCYSSGDCAGLYVYPTSVGGATGVSDEGWTGMHINGGEVTTVYSGTASAGNTRGSTTINRSTDNATCDQCYMVDESDSPATITFTGPAVAVGNYFSEPISGSVTPSTAYGNLSCIGGIPQLANQTVPQSVTCTATGILGTNAGGFTTGLASLSGDYSEQVLVTAVGTISGGSQSVTFTYRNPEPVAAPLMLWQGGSVQGREQSHDYLLSYTGFPQMETCFGAPDSSHLACGVQVGGSLQAAQTGIFETASLTTLTVSGTTVTASSTNPYQFVGLATAAISGCSESIINGTETNVVLNANTTVSWTYPGGGTGCASATVTLPTSYATAHLYCYAETTAADPGNGVTTLEPNGCAWANGDTLVQPHPPTFSGAGIWNKVVASNNTQSSSLANLLLDGSGTAVGNGFTFIHARSQNPETLYQGDGGVFPAPVFMNLFGPNSGSSITEPQPGGTAIGLSCRISGCNNLPINVMGVGGLSNNGLLQFFPATGSWIFGPSLTAQNFSVVGTETVANSTITNLFTTGTPQFEHGAHHGDRHWKSLAYFLEWSWKHKTPSVYAAGSALRPRISNPVPASGLADAL